MPKGSRVSKLPTYHTVRQPRVLHNPGKIGLPPKLPRFGPTQNTDLGNADRVVRWQSGPYASIPYSHFAIREVITGSMRMIELRDFVNLPPTFREGDFYFPQRRLSWLVGQPGPLTMDQKLTVARLTNGGVKVLQLNEQSVIQSTLQEVSKALQGMGLALN